jgi:hypothetical protein
MVYGLLAAALGSVFRDGVVVTDLLLDTGHRMPSNGPDLADLAMMRVTPEGAPVRWRAYDAGKGASHGWCHVHC